MSIFGLGKFANQSSSARCRRKWPKFRIASTWCWSTFDRVRRFCRSRSIWNRIYFVHQPTTVQKLFYCWINIKGFSSQGGTSDVRSSCVHFGSPSLKLPKFVRRCLSKYNYSIKVNINVWHLFDIIVILSLHQLRKRYLEVYCF